MRFYNPRSDVRSGGTYVLTLFDKVLIEEAVQDGG